MSKEYNYKEIKETFSKIKDNIDEYRETFLKNAELFIDMERRKAGMYDQAEYNRLEHDIHLTLNVLTYICEDKLPTDFEELFGIEVLLKVLKYDLGEPSEKLIELWEFIGAIEEC